MVRCMGKLTHEDSCRLKDSTTTARQSAHQSQTQQLFRIVLMLMIMASMLAHVVDVKGSFLHGEFEDKEVIHMKVPQGFEKNLSEGSDLLLLKCLYGLKQAAKAFWRQLLRAVSAMGLKRSAADPCLYYKWVNGRLVMMMSWIYDNAIVGQENDIMEF